MMNIFCFKNVSISCFRMCFAALFFVFAVFGVVAAESRSTPKYSKKMAGKQSRFSLEDPRVSLKNIKESRKVKEPAKKVLPKGATGSPYTAEEEESISIIEDLIKAYRENQFRPDGFGVEITREIVVTLGEIKSKRAVEFLCSLLLDEGEIIELKADIVESLLKIEDKKAVDALNKHLDYLNKNKPDDPMAGRSWQDWIEQTQNATNILMSK